MTPARSTLGSGPTNHAYPMTADTPRPTRSWSGAPAMAARPTTRPSTMATFPPETASRCDSPLSCMAAASSGLCRESSPIASPAAREAASGSVPS